MEDSLEDSINKYIQRVAGLSGGIGGGQPLPAELVEDAIAVGDDLRVTILERRQAIIEGEYEKAIAISDYLTTQFRTLVIADSMVAEIAKMGGESNGVKRNRQERLEEIPESERTPVTKPNEMLTHMIGHLVKAKEGVLLGDWLKFAEEIASVHGEANDIFEAHKSQIVAAGVAAALDADEGEAGESGED